MNNSQHWLLQAKQQQYALGAFNFVNMEALKAIVVAANELNSPVMIQTSNGAIDYAGLDYLVALAQAAKKMSAVPLLLHLDHGDYDHALACIATGAYDSIMFDGSMLPDEENIRLTREIVTAAHGQNVTVEAEIGRVGGVEDHISVSEQEERYTQPEEAVNFVTQTGVDFLAIAIGTAHGKYHGAPVLKFDLIREIAAVLPQTPLVMHGSSGVPVADIKQAIAAGISKINIDTDLRQAFTDSIRQTLTEKPEEIDLRKYLAPAQAATSEVVKEKIEAFGSKDRIN